MKDKNVSRVTWAFRESKFASQGFRQSKACNVFSYH